MQQSHFARYWLPALLILLGLAGLMGRSAAASGRTTLAQDPGAAGVTVVDATGQVIHYQGRLLAPGSGQPKPDGVYPFVFAIYDVANGGAALWTESKSLTVAQGLFSTLLGDTTAMPAGLFNGTERYLGVAVGGESEAIPRVRLAFVPHAIFAANADTVDGQHASAFAPAGHTHDGATIVDGSIASADVADNSLTDADIRDTVRNISFPAQALNRDPTSTVITSYGTGLRWQANFSSGAFLALAKPSDWNGGDVTLSLYFFPFTSTSGNVDFFIRPRSYNPNDGFGDASSQNSNAAIPVSTGLQVKEQQFTVPASKLGRDLWVFTMQRGGSGETSTADVVLMSVKLAYTATR